MANENERIIAEKLTARFCHDYVAPLTAISNSCELAEISPKSMPECVDLITESVASAIAVLQLYRVAFGSTILDEEFPLRDLKRRLDAYVSSRGCTIVMDYDIDRLTKSDAKIIALALLCMISSFRDLQQFEVTKTANGWEIRAIGELMITPEGNLRTKPNWSDEAEIDSTTIHFPILFSTVQTCGYQLEHSIDEGEFKLKLAA